MLAWPSVALVLALVPARGNTALDDNHTLEEEGGDMDPDGMDLDDSLPSLRRKSLVHLV